MVARGPCIPVFAAWVCAALAGCSSSAERCAETRDCGPAMVCDVGVCRWTCDSSKDCPLATEACVSGACRPPSTSDCDGAGCVGSGPLGAACGGNPECASGHCVDGVCCDAACSGTCMTCNPSGHCVAPADDAACGTVECDGLDTRCRDYRDLTSKRCAAVGVCFPANSAGCTEYTSAPASTACEPLVERGLMVRYFLNEAASGVAPRLALDTGRAPQVPLELIYASGGPTYVSAATGRGLAWSEAASEGRACAATADTKLTGLHGLSALTLEAVVDIEEGLSFDARILNLGWDLTQTASLVYRHDPSGPDSTPRVVFGWGDSQTAGAWVANLDVAGRVVLHVVVDSTRSNSDNRVRLFANGALVPPDTSYERLDQLEQGETLDLGLTNLLCVGNRHYPGVSDQRAPRGTIYYGAYYDVALTQTEVQDNAARLLANDDP